MITQDNFEIMQDNLEIMQDNFADASRDLGAWCVSPGGRGSHALPRPLDTSPV